MSDEPQVRTSNDDTTIIFDELFRALPGSDDRERDWQNAVSNSRKGPESLRFPIYESLLSINVHSQKLVDLMDELNSKYGLREEQMGLLRAMVQYVRAAVSQSIVDSMNGVELTEAWLFERLLIQEEEKLEHS